MSTTPIMPESPANANASAPTPAKKTRAASLPAKYAKFIQFGYYLMKQMNVAAETAPTLDESAFLNHIHLFDSVDAQQSFVQQFFNESKNINLTMRKTVQLRNKQILQQQKLAAKPIKEKKVRATTNVKKNNKM